MADLTSLEDRVLSGEMSITDFYCAKVDGSTWPVCVRKTPTYCGHWKFRNSLGTASVAF